MPKEARQLRVTDPFSHSIQWSRRFIGLKLFLTLMSAGWDGYREIIDHQAAMGDLLRERLCREGWAIKNATKLPIVCFTDASNHWDSHACQQVADAVTRSGRAWISTIQLGPEKTAALRACVANFNTQPEHIDQVAQVLCEARRDHR